MQLMAKLAQGEIRNVTQRRFVRRKITIEKKKRKNCQKRVNFNCQLDLNSCDNRHLEKIF